MQQLTIEEENKEKGKVQLSILNRVFKNSSLTVLKCKNDRKSGKFVKVQKFLLKAGIKRK